MVTMMMTSSTLKSLKKFKRMPRTTTRQVAVMRTKMTTRTMISLRKVPDPRSAPRVPFLDPEMRRMGKKKMVKGYPRTKRMSMRMKSSMWQSASSCVSPKQSLSNKGAPSVRCSRRTCLKPTSMVKRSSFSHQWVSLKASRSLGSTT